MFEAQLVRGSLLKKIIESIKELVTDANFDCSPTGFALQAMDHSHISLVSLLIKHNGFQKYRCDETVAMGVNIPNMSKALKFADNDDTITFKAVIPGDTVTFTFESSKPGKISDFELKLVDTDSEHLGIPDNDWAAIVTLPSAEFQRICKDLASIGDSVTIDVSRNQVRFSTEGDIGSAAITLTRNTTEEANSNDDEVVIDLRRPLCLAFALRFLNSFTKATPLSSHVILSMSRDLPIRVEYKIEDIGHVQFFLAPKIDDAHLDSIARSRTM